MHATLRNVTDLVRYIHLHLETEPLAEKVIASGLSPSSIVELLKRKSAGNFLYVKQAIEGVKVGNYQLAQLSDLPAGLYGLYRAFFAREFPNPDDDSLPESQNYSLTRTLLEVIIAAQEPLSNTATRACGRPGRTLPGPSLASPTRRVLA